MNLNHGLTVAVVTEVVARLAAYGLLWMPIAALLAMVAARSRGLSGWRYAAMGAAWSALFLLPWVHLMVHIFSKATPWPSSEWRPISYRARMLVAAVVFGAWSLYLLMMLLVALLQVIAYKAWIGIPLIIGLLFLVPIMPALPLWLAIQELDFREKHPNNIFAKYGGAIAIALVYPSTLLFTLDFFKTWIREPLELLRF